MTFENLAPSPWGEATRRPPAGCYWKTSIPNQSPSNQILKHLIEKNEPFVCEMTVMWHMSQLPVVQMAAGLVPPWPGSILLPWGPPWSCTSGLCLDCTCWDYSCFRAPHISGMQQKPSLKGLSCVLTHSRQLEDLLWLLPSTDLASSCWMAPLIMISLFSLADHSRCSSV